MNFSFGVYDMLANIIPGALQLLVLLYVSIRLSWLQPETIGLLPGALQLVAGLGAAMLVGHLIYPVGLALAKRRNYTIETQVRAGFSEKHPTHAGRAFLDMHFNTLVDAIMLHSSGAAAQVDRVGATGVMLRNTVVPALSAAAVAGGEAFVSDDPALASCVLGLSLLAALSACVGGFRFFTWHIRSILNLACWVPDIDTLGPMTGLSARTEPTMASPKVEI